MLTDEEWDVYFELRTARVKMFYIVEQNVPTNKEETMMDYCEHQLDQIWRPEFVTMYKEGRLVEIMMEWDSFELRKQN